MAMDSEGKFWVTIWAIFAVIILGVAGTISSCVQQDNQRDNETMQKAVASGVDPLVARCAVHGVSNDSNMTTICALAIQKGQAAPKP